MMSGSDGGDRHAGSRELRSRPTRPAVDAPAHPGAGHRWSPSSSTSVLILWAKANPFEAYYYFLIAPLSSRVSALEVLVKATPLLLTGAAVTFAFSAGYWNIGAEGQLYGRGHRRPPGWGWC